MRCPQSLPCGAVWTVAVIQITPVRPWDSNNMYNVLTVMHLHAAPAGCGGDCEEGAVCRAARGAGLQPEALALMTHAS